MRFTEFNFHPNILSGIGDAGYTNPTPIQEQTIPPILQHKDVLGLAQTGTGRAAAFVLPILQRLVSRSSAKFNALPRVLIMAPTLELAEQIHENIEMITIHTSIKSLAIYGEIGKNPQKKTIRKGVDIIVACPGRLLDLMNENSLTLKDIEVLILDEADQMLDMGFLPDIKRTIRYLPKERQTLVFSRTKHKAKSLAIQLKKSGFSAVSL